jgi:hypothetical protein
LVAAQHGGGLTEIGRHYDLPDFHVMLCASMGRRKFLKSCLQASPDGAIMFGM